MEKKILILEDSEFDAELIIRELRNSRIQFNAELARNKREFENLVTEFDPDIVLSDYNLKAYNGLEALTYLKESKPGIPFVVLSGSLTKKMELSLLKTRANDVITKDNLSRLSFALERALNESEDKVKLEENLRIQEAVAEISMKFNSLDPFETKMREVLEIIGETAKVSRVYVFEDYDENRKSKNTFEWCAEGVLPQIDELQDFSYEDDMPFWWEYMAKKGRIYSNDIRNLPQEFQEILVPQNIKALLIYPILIGEEQFGFVGFDETRTTREWPEYLARMLKTVSGLIANAFKEDQFKKQLQKKNEELIDSLEEQRVLLAEVHHRVKNNLALISSFLQLERLKQKDAWAIEILDVNLLRIKSIAIVQELIYQSGSLKNVDIVKTIKTLLKILYETEENLNPDFLLNNAGEKIYLNVNQAIPFALLISEMYYRIFNFDTPGLTYIPPDTIEIDIKLEGELFIVQVKDKPLHNILKKIPTLSEFSEIAKVLGTQLKAEVRTVPESDISQISFYVQDKKGSSSAIT